MVRFRVVQSNTFSHHPVANVQRRLPEYGKNQVATSTNATNVTAAAAAAAAAAATFTTATSTATV